MKWHAHNTSREIGETKAKCYYGSPMGVLSFIAAVQAELERHTWDNFSEGRREDSTWIATAPGGYKLNLIGYVTSSSSRRTPNTAKLHWKKCMT
jgi:hypothetical protein